MGQLNQTVLFFNNSAGAIYAGSLHYFYESGTTTDLTVYSDPELMVPLPQPVVADSNGVLPQIWLQSAAYRWVGQDSEGNQIFDRDNINLSATEINTASPFVYENLNGLINGFLANGTSIDIQIGQTAFTQGQITADDGLGKEYLILAADSGGDTLLANGTWAHEQENFTNIIEVNNAVSTHDGLALGAVHTNLMTGHNADVSAHGPAIAAHNGLALGAVHTNLMTGHNADTSPHDNILGKLKYFSFSVTSFGTVFNADVTSIDGVAATGMVHTGGTGNYTINFSDTVDIVYVNLFSHTGYIINTGFDSGTSNNNVICINHSIPTLAQAEGSFAGMIWYQGDPS